MVFKREIDSRLNEHNLKMARSELIQKVIEILIALTLWVPGLSMVGYVLWVIFTGDLIFMGKWNV